MLQLPLAWPTWVPDEPGRNLPDCLAMSLLALPHRTPAPLAAARPPPQVYTNPQDMFARRRAFDGLDPAASGLVFASEFAVTGGPLGMGSTCGAAPSSALQHSCQPGGWGP